MATPLNSQKSKRLRPLRIVLAVLIAVLIVLVLDRLSAPAKNRPAQNTATSTATEVATPTNLSFYYLYGFSEMLDEDLEARLQDLGVPEEEYQNLSEYLSKDEIFVYETKATLAAELEEVYVAASKTDLAELRQIFAFFDEDFATEFTEAAAAPAEYKILADLLAEYHKTLNTVEDYDAPAE